MSDTPRHSSTSSASTKALVMKLVLAVVGMFGFGFALVPLYDVFCEWTGLNGKTGGRVEYSATQEVNKERVVTVQFTASNNAAMSWTFEPMVHQVAVHPGELTEIRYFARNPGASRMVAQAVPSVSPLKAADYLRKTECFCFTQRYWKPANRSKCRYCSMSIPRCRRTSAS